MSPSTAHQPTPTTKVRLFSDNFKGCGFVPQPFLFAVEQSFPCSARVGTLLVDNSNTRTKFALAENGQLTTWRGMLLTEEITEQAVHDLTHALDVEASVLCSVVPKKAALLTSALGKRGPTHAIGHLSNLPIAIDYPTPSQIGADRLANAVAVHARFGSPAIVVDFGTAVTFDVLSASASYLGGAIAPGLSSMTESLARRTALLPQIELAEPTTAVGKSTEEAMQIGAVIGYRGLIREILTAIKAEIEFHPTIVATGGDAELISRGLPEITHVLPDLTLEGILEIGLLNQS